MTVQVANAQQQHQRRQIKSPAPAVSTSTSSAPSAAQSGDVVDDTLILTLTPGADMDKVNETLSELNATVIRTLHVNGDNYTILFIKPEKGKTEDTLKKISSKKDKNIKAVSRNRRLHSAGQAVAQPNDPDYPDQWNLATINWVSARDTYISRVRMQPRVIDIDSGVEPIRTHNELNCVTQYKSRDGVSEPVLEKPHDDMIDYASAPGHGTACCDMFGALTDNNTDTCGVSSFCPSMVPSVVEFRVLGKNDSTSSADMVMALTYIINHNASLGRFTPVNISIYSEDPPTYAEEPFTSLSESLYKLGSLAVYCSGDAGADNSQYPIGYSRVVQGTDINNHLGTGEDNSDYAGPNMPAAPGYGVYLIWGNHELLYSYGTSFASPTWAGCIAVLQAIRPDMTAPQADCILVQTARKVKSPYPGGGSNTTTLLLPNLKAAIDAALGCH